MSKLGPLGQSMAALFNPDRGAKGKTEATGGAAASKPAAAFRVPGTGEPQKSHDSLGNPDSPGYEPWGKKKKEEAATEEKAAESPLAHAIETPVQSDNLIRLSLGWDKLLVAQKKICEKAKGIFTRLEGSGNYAQQRRGKVKFLKSSGCILDLDSKDVAPKVPEVVDPKKKNIA